MKINGRKIVHCQARDYLRFLSQSFENSFARNNDYLTLPNEFSSLDLCNSVCIRNHRNGIETYVAVVRIFYTKRMCSKGSTFSSYTKNAPRCYWLKSKPNLNHLKYFCVKEVAAVRWTASKLSKMIMGRKGWHTLSNKFLSTETLKNATCKCVWPKKILTSEIQFKTANVLSFFLCVINLALKVHHVLHRYTSIDPVYRHILRKTLNFKTFISTAYTWRFTLFGGYTRNVLSQTRDDEY